MERDDGPEPTLRDVKPGQALSRAAQEVRDDLGFRGDNEGSGSGHEPLTRGGAIGPGAVPETQDSLSTRLDESKDPRRLAADLRATNDDANSSSYNTTGDDSE